GRDHEDVENLGADGATLVNAQLVERSDQVAVLDSCFAEVRDGSGGRLVLVRGEAGIGETALVRRVCDGRSSPSLGLWVQCAPLFAPRPLAPLVEIADVTGGRLEELAECGGTPHQMLEAMGDEAVKGRPTVVVLENLHWADEATLDVLRLLGRRIDSFPGLVVATYRDDELDQAPRLRILLGEPARIPGVPRMGLARLAPGAGPEVSQ